jgi:hypothetical protein
MAPLIKGVDGNPFLAEFPYGKGTLIIGTMSGVSLHTPTAAAATLRSKIHLYNGMHEAVRGERLVKERSLTGEGRGRGMWERGKRCSRTRRLVNSSNKTFRDTQTRYIW